MTELTSHAYWKEFHQINCKLISRNIFQPNIFFLSLQQLQVQSCPKKEDAVLELKHWKISKTLWKSQQIGPFLTKTSIIPTFWTCWILLICKCYKSYQLSDPKLLLYYIVTENFMGHLNLSVLWRRSQAFKNHFSTNFVKLTKL